MNESTFAEKIKLLGGKAYIVGGWVRDMLRGKQPKDKDYVITGIDEGKFQQNFPDADRVGKSFPVYLLEIDQVKAEVALARKEEKCGLGYKGFSVQYSPEVSIEEDLYRRDTTMNSMAFSLDDKKIIDPYHGLEDIKKGVINATSTHFLEDPVRALRAARQAAQTGFIISASTIDMMKICRQELLHEPKERIVGELTKALAAERPSAFFQALREADLLDITFAEIFALIGKAQPKVYHPEGDAFVHSLLVLDKAAALTRRTEVRFAALVHDIGKGLTRQADLPHHYGHEKVGMEALQSLNQRLCLPKLWIHCAAFVIREHMRVTTIKKPAKVVAFLLALEKNPIGIDGFSAVIEADHGSLPELLQNYVQALYAIRMIRGTAVPAALYGSQISDWIKQKQIEAYCNFVKNR